MLTKTYIFQFYSVLNFCFFHEMIQITVFEFQISHLQKTLNYLLAKLKFWKNDFVLIFIFTFLQLYIFISWFDKVDIHIYFSLHI